MAAVATTMAIGVQPTSTGVTTNSRSSNALPKSGLSAAERAALRVVSVRASGDPSLGIVVTATFGGNIER